MNKELINKLLNGQATPDEEHFVARMLQQEQDMESWLTEDNTTEYDRIVSQRRARRRFLRWAAAVIFAIVLPAGAVVLWPRVGRWSAGNNDTAQKTETLSQPRVKQEPRQASTLISDETDSVEQIPILQPDSTPAQTAYPANHSAYKSYIQQRILDYYKRVPQEQIYVHTDKPYYVPGDTVWFRAHLVDAVTHTPVSRSRYVYVELRDPQPDTLVQRIIVKCDSDGVFANALFLPRELKGGSYTLAAYTQWMRNFPAERFFYKQLLVAGSTSLAEQKPDPVWLPVSSLRAASSLAKVQSVALQSLTSGSGLKLGQRKGQLFIQLHKYTVEPLVCVLYGSGNLIVADYTPGKVLRIDSETLRPGNLSVAMVRRETGDIVAESQTDIKGGEPQVTISGQAQSHNDPMELNIDIADADGTPLNGCFSLSVTDYGVVKPDSRQPTIDKYLSRQAADYSLANMLSGTYPRIGYGFQTQQLITGRVKGSLGQRIKKPHLLVVNNRTGQQWDFELGDSTRFSLAVDNPEGSVFTLEGTRRSGKTSFVELEVDSQTFPKVMLPRYQLTASAADLTDFKTQARMQQMYNRESHIELPEVAKVGKKRKPLKSNIMGIEAPRGYQQGDPRIERAATMQQLLTSLGMRIQTAGNGEQYITTPDHAGVKVYLDNFVEPEEEHSYVLSIPPTGIRSIEYFTPNNAINGFFGGRPKSYSGKVPGVLFVFMKDGSEIVRTRAKDRLSFASVQQLGYRRPVEFYSPQYTDKSKKTRPDHRTTLYWNPKVATDNNGHATVRFYTSDISKRYLVTLEGVSDNGIVVHQQQIVESETDIEPDGQLKPLYK